MPVLAIVYYVVYLIVAFVLRGLVQWRRTGDAGFRFGAEAPGSPQWWARLGFVAALAGGAAAPVLAVIGVHGPIGVLDRTPVAAVGAVIAGAGIVATTVAQVAMGRSWRVGVDPGEVTELVVRWPFTVVRNPIFTAMGVTAVGLVLMVPSVLAITALVGLGWALWAQVCRVEEPYLREVHGRRYEEYAASVGRFLPRVGRWRSPRPDASGRPVPQR